MSKEEISQWSLKYRPHKWEDIYGQDNTVKALKERILKNDIPSAVMFQGPFGCGKTTLAQLFAAAIQSHDSQGNPNWGDPACKAILDETFDRDTIRLDGSQFSGKSDVIDFMSSINVRPMLDKKRIIIIEECDLISTAGMSSLLKILESLKPWNCIILLSMGDKISGAIKSRCQYYQIKSIGVKDIMMNLKHVMEQTGDWDNKNIPDEFRLQGLSAIASASQGSMRQAVQFLEQCIINEAWSVEAIDDLIGVVDEEKTWRILDELLLKSKDEKMWRTLIGMKSGDEAQHFFNYCSMLLSEAMIYKDTGISYDGDFAEKRFKSMIKSNNLEELFYCLTLHPQMNKPFIRTTDILSALSCYYEGVSFNPLKKNSSGTSIKEVENSNPPQEASFSPKIKIGTDDMSKYPFKEPSQNQKVKEIKSRPNLKVREKKSSIGELDIVF